MIKQRNKLRNYAEKYNDQNIHEQYKQHAKITKKMVKEDKKIQQYNKMNNGILRQTWNEAKKIMNTKQKNKQPDMLIEKGQEITDKKEMAEILNEHYYNKIKTIKENI